MSIRWQTNAQQQLVIERNGGRVGLLLGGLLALPSGYFLYALIMEWGAYGRALLAGEAWVYDNVGMALLGTLLTLLFALLFGIPAWLLIGKRIRITLDPVRATITELSDYRLFQQKREYHVQAFTRVDVALAEQSRSVLFDVTLRGKKQSLDLATMDRHQIPQALALGKAAATLLGYQFRADVGDWATVPSPSLRRYPWQGRYWRDLVQGFTAGAPWQHTGLPAVILGRIQWEFAGSPYRAQGEFDRAVSAYQVDHGAPAEEWEPAAVAFPGSQIAIQYDEPSSGEWRQPILELSADNGEQFTNSELLFKIHNGIVNHVRDSDLRYCEGLELLDKRWKAGIPCYRLVQVR